MQLDPMTQEEFDAYLERLIPDYAAQHVRAGNWPEDEAETRAAQQIRDLLPEGLQSPGHHIYTIRDAPGGTRVGMIWLAITERGAFIYDVVIDEAHRRQGYASQALTAIEDKARELGQTSIALHVFGHNHAARALYDKLDYTVTDLWMKKDL